MRVPRIEYGRIICNISPVIAVVKSVSLFSSTLAHLLWVPCRQTVADTRSVKLRSPKTCTSSPRMTSCRSPFRQTPGTIQVSSIVCNHMTDVARLSARVGQRAYGASIHPCRRPIIPGIHTGGREPSERRQFATKASNAP